MTTNKPPKHAIAVSTNETTSQALARLLTDGTAAATTVHAYADAGPELDVNDLVKAMRQAGDEAVAGNMARTERMLANQLLTLDLMFNSLARRAQKQESFRGIETLTRLALKAQSQSRATAETLAAIKNPMPAFVGQANITSGPQQINNGPRPTGAGNFQSRPNEVLERSNEQRMDAGATQASGRGNQALEAVGAVNRPSKRRG